MDLSLIGFRALKDRSRRSDGRSMVEIQRSQQLQAHRFYPLKQRRRSPTVSASPSKKHCAHFRA